MTFLVRECYESPEKHENSLKFAKIRAEECFDKVLNEELKKKLMCKMKNVITRVCRTPPLKARSVFCVIVGLDFNNFFVVGGGNK
jgi:hypothetical protein